MAIRPKTKRRVLIIVVVAALLVTGLYGLYLMGQRSIRKADAQARMDGLQAYQEKDWGKAIENLNKYIKRHGTDTNALKALAISRKNKPEENGQHTDAIGLYRTYVGLVPTDTDAAHDLLTMEAQAGQSDPVIQLANQLLAKDPNDTIALRALAQTLSGNGKFKEALVSAEKYNDLVPTDLDGHALTYSLMQQLEIPTKRMLDRAATFEKKYPTDPRMKLARVIATFYGKDPTLSASDVRAQNDAAIKLLVSITGPDVAPPDAKFVSWAVRLLDSAGKYSDSEALLARAATTLKTEQAVRLMYAQRLWESKQFGAVATLLSDVTPASNDVNSSLLAFKALALNELNQKPESLELVSSLASRKDDEEAAAWAMGLQAVFHPEQNDVRKRFEDLNAATVRDRHNGVLRMLLAQEYQNASEDDLAYEQSLAASQLMPSWAAPHLFLANILARRGNIDRALNESQMAYRSDSPVSSSSNLDREVTKAFILAELCEAHNDESMKRKLATELEALRKNNPEDTRTLPLYVQLLAQTKQLEKARAVISDEMANPAKAGGQGTLLELEKVSLMEKLGLEDQILDVTEKKFGLSPDLGLARAGVMASKQVPPAQVVRYLTDSARHGTGEQWQWQMALALYLDAAHDAGAKDAWEKLGNDYPDNLEVQDHILNQKVASSVWEQDRPFVATTIERLKNKTGNDALSWKLAKAKLLLSSNDSKDANDASFLLSEVLKHPTAAEQVEPHLLQARAMEKLRNLDGAIGEMVRAANISTDVHIGYDLLRLYYEAGRTTDARQAYLKIMESPALTPGMAQNAAGIMYQQREMSLAAQLLERFANSSDPTQATSGIIGLLAMTDQQMGKIKDAGELYLRLLNSPDLKPTVAESAAGFFAGWGQPTTAKKFLAKLDDLKLNPGEKDAALAEFEERFGGDPTVARQHYIDAIAADKNNAAPVAKYIAYLDRQNQLAEASQTADRALQSWPNDPQLQTLKLLSAAMTSTPYASSLKTVVIAFTNDLGNPAAAPTLQALSDAANHPAAETLDHLQQLVKSYPGFYPLYELTVRQLLLDPRPEAQAQGIEMASQAMDRFPDFPAAGRLACVAQAQANRWNEALQSALWWHARVAQQPEEADWYIAVCQVNLGHAGDALTKLEPYIVDAKQKPEVPINKQIIRVYAGALLLSNRTDAADALLRPLATTSDTWRQIWLGLSRDSIASGDDAATWINRIVPLIASDNLGDNVQLAQAWYDVALRRSYPKGFQNCCDLLKPRVDKLDQPALLTLARAEQEVKDPDSIDSFRRAIKADPTGNSPLTASAENSLANLLLARSDDASLAEAATLAGHAAKLTTAEPSEQSYYQYTLARIFLKEGKADQAADEFKKADAISKNNPNVMIGWADALVKSNKVDKARVKIQELDMQLSPGTRLAPDLEKELAAVRAATVLKPARSSVSNTESSPVVGRP